MGETTTWVLERLDPEQHNVRKLRSGNEKVDAWLREVAKHALSADTSITHVLAERTSQPGSRRRVVAYFSLAMADVDISSIPESEREGLPSGHRVPGALLTWLGIDRTLQGRGMGKTMLRMATRKVVTAGEVIAARIMITDAIDARAQAFYEHFGFVALPTRPDRLIMSIARLRRWLGS